ncbi:MAG: S9 family peptidase [Cyclobacteriaceae bacterium]|nr:S9 family peptidase [Cyclobacteriaceae bacterium]
MKNIYLVCFLLWLPLRIVAQQVPSFEQVIALRNAGAVSISPDGKHVAYTVQTTDWNDNRYDTEIWLSKNGQKSFQLTNTQKGSSISPRWSPDGKWIAFLADRGNKNQIHVIYADGGEAKQITNEEENINDFEWHPYGATLIFSKPEKADKSKKELEKRYGAFETDDKDFTLSHLWQINFDPGRPSPTEMPCHESVDSLKTKAGCIEWPKATRLTEGKFTVTSFLISPDGNKIAFSHQPDPLINSFFKSDISLIDLNSKEITLLVNNPSNDNLQEWSPDSKELLYTTSLADTTSNYYRNNKLFSVSIDTKATRQLAKNFDEQIGGLVWRNSGIYFTTWNKTKRPMYKINPRSGDVSVFLNTPDQIFGVSFSKSGDRFAVNARSNDQLNEIFITSTASPKVEKITDMTGQISNWKAAQSEIVSWKSKDGAMIEGVLHKPKNYDPAKKYPLLVVVHGGPTGIDTPQPVPGYVYPIVQWLDKGALVLRPNYRGSAGYGEAFRSLNVENLGVGDAWDVLSGIEYLDSKGMIDKNKMGCMGWSQGGYISAFLTTSSDVFKATSVGAGISNWMTYYVNTDIHPFTRQYLKATPWDNEEIYRKTSPMTYINQAKTPTLIQHGEFDRRVPIPNAYELLQGLRDKNVPSELIVYKGFGHGITKPKERLAATWHNWQWFNKYVWGEEVELPVGSKE